MPEKRFSIKKEALNKYLIDIFIAFFYLIMACAYCYPAFFEGKNILGIWDNKYMIWEMWTLHKNLFVEPNNPWIVDNIYYPYGYISILYVSIIPDLIGSVLLNFFNLITTYNIIIIFSFFSAALFMYIFLNYLFKDKWAAFFGGCLYGFSSYTQVLMTYGHNNLICIQFFPLFVMSVFMLKEKITPFRNLFFFISYVLLGLTNPYYFIYLLVFFLTYLVIYDHFTKKLSKEFLLNFIVISFFATIVLFMFYYPNQVGKYDSPDVKYLKNIGSYAYFSNDAINFFIPPPTNPLWRHFTIFLNGKLGHGDTQFFGYSVLALVFITLFFSKWKDKKFWLIYLIIVSILSLGPLLKFYGHVYKIPLPYLVFTKTPIVWGLRAPSRLNAAIIFSLCILTAEAIRFLKCKYSSKIFYPVYIILLLAVLYENIYLDYSVLPEPKSINVRYSSAEIPAFYKDLANRDDVNVLMELPSGNEQLCEIYDYEYMYYQTYHNKKIMSGKVPRYLEKYEEIRTQDPILKYFYVPALISSMSKEEREKVVNGTIPKLKELKVDYLILHPLIDWIIPTDKYNDLKNLIFEIFGNKIEQKDNLWVVDIRKL